jgi:thiamine biosynthesis lipoprotein
LMILAVKLIQDNVLERLLKVSLWRVCGLVLLSSLLLSGCDRGPEIVKISGTKMGTTYHITVVADQPAPDNLAVLIEAELDRVDYSMSTYKPDSEINRFNQLAVDQSMTVSLEFFEVLTIAQSVWLNSNGALDPSVGPLVDLWGFGPSLTEGQIPSEKQITIALAAVGFDALIIDSSDQSVIKARPVVIDLSAVAKGYAVDLVADLLEMNALPDYLIEIGGETRVSGLNPQGQPWRLAIESPLLIGQIETVLALTSGAVATSGDYRNYFERDGIRYSHTIDPRDGKPIIHTLASVTVMADTCAEADAWATALLVLGNKEGLDLANRLGLAVYMLVRDGDEYTTSYSKMFEPYLVEITEQAALVES